MEKEAALVGLDSGLAFEPVLEQRQWARPRKQFREYSPEKGTDVQPAKNWSRARYQGPKDYPHNEERMQNENEGRKCRIDARSCMRS